MLVLGGSGGARALNQQLPLAVYKSGAALTGWEIVHQCGQRDLEATASLYAKLAITARVTPFIDDMADMLAGTDVAISRAGGTTLAEFAAARVPAILLPYPRATDDAINDTTRKSSPCAPAPADSSTKREVKGLLG